jgi:hypothetical protein
VGCNRSRATEDAARPGEAPPRKSSAATVSPTRWPPRAAEPIKAPLASRRRCPAAAAAWRRSRGRRRRESPDLDGSGSTSHRRAARAGALPPCAVGRDASRLHALACWCLRRVLPPRAGGQRSRAGAHGDHRPTGFERTVDRSLHDPTIYRLRAATILPIPSIDIRKSEELRAAPQQGFRRAPPSCETVGYPVRVAHANSHRAAASSA